MDFNILGVISDAVNKFYNYLKTVLPLSPFSGVNLDLSNNTGLRWLNWFFPVGDILNVFLIYLGAVALYYIYGLVLRWIKAVE